MVRSNEPYITSDGPEDTKLIRVSIRTCGMNAGDISRVRTPLADVLIAAGYAVDVGSLEDRKASEPPERHESGAGMSGGGHPEVWAQDE